MKAALQHGHAPPSAPEGGQADIEATESVLADWFGADVVLTSSGRAGLLLSLRALGLDRYRDRLAMSPMVSGCVLDAVTRAAFPVDPAGASPTVSASLVIHQYGFRQRWHPGGPVIEDVCHAFFGASGTGEREWQGQVAVFSLPKFTATTGMAGGIVVRSPGLAATVRDLVAESPERSPAHAAKDRTTFREKSGGVEMELMYLRALLMPRPDPAALAGSPTSVADWKKKGEARHDRVARLVAAAPASALDNDWGQSLLQSPPFVVPLFGPEERLRRLDGAMAQIGVSAGRYQIDRRRDALRPVYGPALLLPCHDYIPDDIFVEMEELVRSFADD